jgi:hypothetical protein
MVLAAMLDGGRVVEATVAVGEATLDPPPEEELLWLEMDMGETRSLDSAEPVSLESSSSFSQPLPH